MAKKSYYKLSIYLPSELYESAYSVLCKFDHIGIEEQFDCLVVWFDLKNDSFVTPETALQTLCDLLNDDGIPAKRGGFEIIEEQNWNAQWEAQMAPVKISDRITITPSWHKDTIQSPLTIVINPQMSFGTGHHETTRLSTRLLETIVKPKTRWIDAGTGTGILAIVAAFCGAQYVFAFDYDEWSVQNARENIALNAIKNNVIELSLADVFEIQLPEVDGITANLHKNILLSVFPKFYAALSQYNGDLIVSGLLHYDEQEVCNAAAQAGFSHLQTLRETDWIAIHFHVNKKSLQHNATMNHNELMVN